MEFTNPMEYVRKTNSNENSIEVKEESRNNSPDSSLNTFDTADNL